MLRRILDNGLHFRNLPFVPFAEEINESNAQSMINGQNNCSGDAA